MLFQKIERALCMYACVVPNEERGGGGIEFCMPIMCVCVCLEEVSIGLIDTCEEKRGIYVD